MKRGYLLPVRKGTSRQGEAGTVPNPKTYPAMRGTGVRSSELPTTLPASFRAFHVLLPSQRNADRLNDNTRAYD